MFYLHYADVNARFLRFILSVNGVPLVASDGGRSMGTIYPISGWLRPSVLNRVRVTVLDSTELSTATVIIRRVVKGVSNDEGDVLWQFAWPLVEAPERGASPFIDERPYVVEPVDLRSHLWRDADVVSALSPGDVRQIQALVESARKLNVIRDWGGLLDLLEYRIHEEARIEGHSFDGLRSVYREQFERLLEGGAIEIPPVDWTQSEMIVGGAGQVVAVTPSRMPTAPILRGRVVGQTETFGVRLFVSRIAGVWRIVRGF